MLKKFILILLFSFSANANQPEKENQSSSKPFSKIDPSRFQDYAILQILDKTTAKSEVVKIKSGDSLNFENIDIKIHKCWQAPLDQKPDSKILMEVFEKKPITVDNKSDQENNDNKIFHGWMIASSPSVSGLQHPVYDIVALDCKEEE